MLNENEYKAENLVEQEGPNKGNISDVELARVGAEAENRARHQEIINKLDYIVDRLEALNALGCGGFYENQKDQRYQRSNVKGTEAMIDEVERRALESSAEKIISPEVRKLIAEKAVSDFIHEVKEKSTTRRQEQLEDNY